MGFFKRLFGKPENEVVTDPSKIPAPMMDASPILDEIAAEAIRGTPENWSSAVLTITCDGQRMNYSLKNDRNEGGRASISPRLAQLAEALWTTMGSMGERWTKAVLRYEQATGDSWNFKSDFSYD